MIASKAVSRIIKIYDLRRLIVLFHHNLVTVFEIHNPSEC